MKTLLMDIGLGAINIVAWTASISQGLNLLQQIATLVVTGLSIYLLIMRIKKFKKQKNNNDDGDNLFIG
ncbi:MAG: hypothetical protein F9K23_00755 [Bacteroidetes bacterium]|nr:MAG: hypothetical protein F9K23_00755 [Bacteroidota bacterium]